MQLNEILDSGQDRWNICESEFYRLKNEALRRKNELDWMVEIIDFANQNNFFSLPIIERIVRGERYKDQKVLFFHENVNETHDLDALSVAAGFIDMSRNDQQEHITLTSINPFLIPKQDGSLESPYATRFHPYRLADREINLGNKYKEILSQINNSLKEWEDRAQVINIIGKSGTGKTQLLRYLYRNRNRNRNQEISKIISMQEYAGENPDLIANDIINKHYAKVLLIDEAGLVDINLHKALVQEYKAIIYASHKKLPFEVSKTYQLTN